MKLTSYSRLLWILILPLIFVVSVAVAPAIGGEVVKLGRQPTASLPAAGLANVGGLIFDTTSQSVKYSDGGAWFEFAGTSSTSPVLAACHTDGGALAMVNGGNRVDFSHCDSSTGVDNTAGAWLFTAPRTGVYSVSAGINFDFAAGAGGATCPTVLAAHRQILATTINGSSSGTPTMMDTWVTNGCDQQMMNGQIYLALTAGDTLFVSYVQATGVTRALAAGIRTRLWIEWVGG